MGPAVRFASGPRILRQGRNTYLAGTGQERQPVLGRWLLLTGELFVSAAHVLASLDPLPELTRLMRSGWRHTKVDLQDLRREIGETCRGEPWYLPHRRRQVRQR